MRIEQLKYFYIVAQTNSINAAAQQLFISQQGISDALKRLEQELGVTLFIRNKLGVTLTTQGKMLLPYVEAILEKYEDMIDYIATAPSFSVSERNIRVLANPFFINTLVPDMIDLLSHTTPPVNMFCSEMFLSDMLICLEKQMADVALFLLMEEDIANFKKQLSPNLTLYKLFDDEMYVACSCHHPLATKNTCTEQEIAKYPMINFHTTYWKGSSINTTLDSSISADSLMSQVNNPLLQYKMITEHQMLATASKLFFRKLFPQSEIMALPYQPPKRLSHFILLQKDSSFQNESPFLQMLAKYCYKISGQSPEYPVGEK